MSAPAQSQEPISELLAEAKAASGGRLLALHNDLARSPAALAAYLGLRRAGIPTAVAPAHLDEPSLKIQVRNMQSRRLGYPHPANEQTLDE